MLNKLSQLRTLKFLGFSTIFKLKHSAFGSQLNQRFLKLPVIIDIFLFLTLCYFIKRRLCNIHMTFFYQFYHLPEEKREKQCPDMRPVYIGIRHDYNLDGCRYRRSEEHTS